MCGGAGEDLGATLDLIISKYEESAPPTMEHAIASELGECFDKIDMMITKVVFHPAASSTVRAR